MRLASNASEPVIKRTDTVQEGPAPRVTVVIPCYNYAEYLADAVISVARQTYQDLEIIIVDDGSTDDTEAVCNQVMIEFGSRRVTVVHQPNSGQPAIARNRGIDLARGELILPLDADDMIQPTLLAEFVAAYDADPKVAIVYSDRRDMGAVDEARRNPDGTSRYVVPANDYNWPKLLGHNQPYYCALFSKAMWRDVGGYRTNVRGAEDWDFWVAAGGKGYFGKRIPKPLLLYRLHGGGLYNETKADPDWYCARVVLNNAHLYQPKLVDWAKSYHARKGTKSDAVGSPDAVPAPEQEARVEAVGTAAPAMSVIIATYQRSDQLMRAIEGFFAQDTPVGSFELIVVDDGSTDATRARCSALEAPIPLVVVGQDNRGVAAARNAGIAAARGELIVFFDDDQVPHPDYLGHHLRAHEDASEVSVVGKAIYPPEQLDLALMKFIDESAMVLAYSRMVDGQLYNWQRYYTGVVSTPKEAIVEVGGFDESFREYGCEDADLGLRLEKQLGYKVRYCAAAVAAHDHGLDLDAFKQRQIAVARAHTRLLSKHPELLDGVWRDVADDTVEKLQSGLDDNAAHLEAAETQARLIGGLNLKQLAELEMESFGTLSLRALKLLIMQLNKAWWDQGFVAGLRMLGVDSFAELRQLK